MTMTLDLPEEVLREIDRRAQAEGRAPADVIAEILAAALLPAAQATAGAPLVEKALPLMTVRPLPVPSGEKLTTQQWCDWIKDVDLQLDVEHYEKALGHQHLDRADG